LETVLVTAARDDFPDQSVDGSHGFFGIEPGGLQRVPIRHKNIWGVRLGSVLTNHPADMAGIRQGDIVIEFDGHPIRTPRELIRRINATEPYSVVEVKVVRRGEELTLPVKMGKDN
jgi:S1-C subfamily serine protease